MATKILSLYSLVNCRSNNDPVIGRGRMPKYDLVDLRF